MLKDKTQIPAVPLRGGMITARPKPLLPLGAFSMVQNLRPTRPGFIKRPGQRKKHSTADGTNKVISLYQFRKNRIDEDHLFGLFSDGDILEATDAPPTVTSGVFGMEVLSSANSPTLGDWASVADILVHSNGVDQHKIYAGKDNYVQWCVAYGGTATLTDIPDEGFDYTDEVTDGLATTVAILDAFGTDSNQGLLICCPVRANRLTFTVSAANGNNVSAELMYRKSDGTWAATEVTGDAQDGTNTGTTTLAQSGSMYWTPPADEIPWYMYGVSGFWYYLKFDAALDAEVEISKITYGTDHDASGARTAFLDLVNIWDGIPVPAIEIQVLYDTSIYARFAAGAVDLGGLAFDENDKIYICSHDPIQGVYLDPGNTPNTDTASAAALTSVKYWDGNSWVALTATDETGGMTSPGWITWNRPATPEHPQQFESTQFYAYWYEIIFDDAISTDVVLEVYTLPYFDIDELGNGQACCAWGDHMVYSFDRWGQYIHVTPPDTPSVLNGSNYDALEAGDGRSNKVIAMEQLHTELITFQEEKGIEGGCTTLFEGYAPGTYGKMLISTSIGILNCKCKVRVDGVLTSTATEEKIKTLIFWLSRKGVCVTDGTSASIISDDIGNYFDPTKDECIRRGYEDQHWMSYDSAFNLIRIGIVSGGSATVPNKFFCFDLTDKVWYEDVLGQELSCVTEVEAGSGDVATVQLGGGTDDGFVYQLNVTQDDVSTLITSYLDVELSSGGEYQIIREAMVRCKTQSAGDITFNTYKNGISSISKTLSMVAEVTNQIVRRHRFHLNEIDQHLSVRLQHATAAQDMDLYSLGLDIDLWDKR